MAHGLLIEQLHFAKGIDPVADVFDGTKRSDVYNMSGWYRGLFIVYCGVATGGTAATVFTVNACDNVTPSTRSAIAGHYREIVTGDTEGAVTAFASTGFTCAAGSSKIILIEIEASALAASGYGYVELTSVESVNDPVVGGVMFTVAEPRYRPAIATTIIV
jgi:hypothetical protein